jgi:hypothetical protein
MMKNLVDTMCYKLCYHSANEQVLMWSGKLLTEYTKGDICVKVPHPLDEGF